MTPAAMVAYPSSAFSISQASEVGPWIRRRRSGNQSYVHQELAPQVPAKDLLYHLMEANWLKQEVLHPHLPRHLMEANWLKQVPQ